VTWRQLWHQQQPSRAAANNGATMVLTPMLLLLLLLLPTPTIGGKLPWRLPQDHNGGVQERLIKPATSRRPHILFVLWDDYGWAGAGYHRAPPTPEVQTPTMDALVRGGIEFTQSYVFYCCSPTRSAIQSGRNPAHVNVLNADPATFNASDRVSGAAGVPRNMTGVATKLAAAGYRTHFVPTSPTIRLHTPHSGPA
jgi:hypothetical protein